MKLVAINNYQIDAKNFNVLCDEKVVGCVETAAKITEVSKKTFGCFTWLKFYAIDFLANFFQYFKERQFSIASAHSQKIVTGQKLYLKTAEKVDRFIRDHFEIVSKNVDHVLEAEIICLGETHETLSHMLRNGQLIDAIGESDDLILVEHDDSQNCRSDQARYVQKPIEIRGWDKRDPELMDELQALYEVNPIDIIGQILFGDAPIDRSEESDALFQRIIDGLPERNRHMCKTIDANFYPGRRIFVIAGQGHFRPPATMHKDGINLQSQQKAYDETLAYLKGKKYAILVPHTERPRLQIMGLGG